MDSLKSINNDFGNRILSKLVLLNNPSADSSLSDIVMLYNNGKIWICLPLKIMQMYPIIHDTYFDSSLGKCDITIYVCPYTLFSCVYFGKYISYDKTFNNNLVLKNDNNVLIPITNQIYSIDTGNITDKYIRKGEVRVMSLKNAIMAYPDCQFISIPSIKKINPINENIDTNIIYIIEYKSRANYDYKYTILMPTKKSFDIQENGFQNYFNKMIEKIREKRGIIYTCYASSWNNVHKTTRIIKL